MVNFGPRPVVCGTPANFNGFRVLAALLHGTPAVGVSQTLRLNRGRHLYSAGRPSRWALAYISSFKYVQQTRTPFYENALINDENILLMYKNTQQKCKRWMGKVQI